jgi:SPP1 gp7 family putative phage head morphogenesis protein
VPLNKVLFDSTVELHLDMERVAIQSRAIIVKLLENLEKELIAKVANGVTDWSKARIDKQLKEASTVIKQYYDEAAGIAKDTTTSVAQVSASATTDSLLMAVGNQVAMAAIPTASYLETLAGNTIIQGAVQSAWWSRQSEDTAFKFQSAVRQGLVGAETTPQIVKRVRGVLDISKRNAETLVHTSVQSVANTTREKIFEDNNDVMSGKEWSAALDRRTCPTCGALDGKRWTTDGKKINHSMVYQIPPKHFKCRCSMIPVLKTWRELGINMDELSDNTRASMEGQVTDKTFEDWLKRKTETDPTFADRTLGKGRAELWRNGKITMDQMISGGKPLSLAELNAKYVGTNFSEASSSAKQYVLKNGRIEQANSIEFMRAYDKNGNTILEKRGEASSVNFSQTEVDAMIKADGVVLAHNHPSGRSLSDADFIMANKVNGEIVAHGHNGIDYYGSVNDLKVYNRFKNLAELGVRNRFQNLIDITDYNDQLPIIKMAEKYHNHAVNSALSSTGAINYRVENMTNVPKQMTDMLDEIIKDYSKYKK